MAMFFIAITPNAVGYELSIYDAYPAPFWYFLIATIAFGVIIMLHQAFFGKGFKWWVVGLAIVLITNTIFLLLPTFRGYALYGMYDTLSHLGYIKDILTTGQLGKNNFYPMVHILGVSLIQVAGLSLENIVPLYFIIFTNTYIINIYLIGKSTSKNHGCALLMVAFATPLIYSNLHVTIHPGTMSLFMTQYLLYFYTKREMLLCDQRKNSILLYLLAFSITFYHPVNTLFMISVFIISGFLYVLYSRLSSHKVLKIEQPLGKNIFGVILIMSIAFSTWYFSFAYIQRSFKVVYDWLIYQSGVPLYRYLTDSLIEARLTPIQTIEIFINRYGAIFILLLISSIACISQLRKSLSKRNVMDVKFMYAILYLFALFIGGVELFGYFIEYNPVRVSRFALLMGTVISALVVYDFINKGPKIDASRTKASRQRIMYTIAIGVIIMVMITLSLGSVFGSPRIWDINLQVTRMDITGTTWFEKIKNPYIVVVTNIPELIYRFEDYNFGVDSRTIRIATVDPVRLPSHFGYDEHDQISESLNFQDRYLVIFSLDKAAVMLFKLCPAPKVHYYSEEDFVKLGSDTTAIKIYSNAEFEVWRIYRH